MLVVSFSEEAGTSSWPIARFEVVGGDDQKINTKRQRRRDAKTWSLHSPPEAAGYKVVPSSDQEVAEYICTYRLMKKACSWRSPNLKHTTIKASATLS